MKRDRLIKMAYEKPSLRVHILPIVKRSLTQYTTLSDAASTTGNNLYGEPGARVWFYKPGTSRDMTMGPDYLSEYEPDLLPRSPKDLQKTHVLVGEIGSLNPQTVFELMQGENWSPQGAARSLIRKLGLAHTSMSIGDVIQIGDALHMVGRSGSFIRVANTESSMGLKEKVIKLAFNHPELRKDLLPLLKSGAKSRSKKENEIAGKLPRGSKKGRGKNREIFVTGRMADVLGMPTYSNVKMRDLSDEQIDKLHDLLVG